MVIEHWHMLYPVSGSSPENTVRDTSLHIYQHPKYRSHFADYMWCGPCLYQAGPPPTHCHLFIHTHTLSLFHQDKSHCDLKDISNLVFERIRDGD